MTESMRTLAAAFLLALLCLVRPASSQEPQEPQDVPLAAVTAADHAPEPVRRDALGTILINGATPYTVPERKLEVLFTHRFQQPVNDGGTSHNLWGLDNGADIGIGAGWGVTSHLDLTLYRDSFQEDFELAGKYLAFEQTRRLPLTLAVRAGADFLRRPGIADPNRPFVQLLLARQLAPGINLLVSPSWVADTPSLKNAFNVPLGLTFPFLGGSLLELEYIPKNRDLESSRAAWHAALSKAVGGHIFEVVLGDSRATTVDQMLGGDSAAGFRTRDLRLGFNIVRDFGF
jgi:hypothetical protein